MNIPLINVGRHEAYFRTALGTLLIIVSPYTYWWFILLGVMVTITGTIHYCPVCHLSGVRSRASLENFYLSYLPRHNSQPVSIFSRSGELNYTNDRFNKQLNHIKTISDFGNVLPDSLDTLINNEQRYRFRFEQETTIYQILIQGVSAIDGLTCYASDITEITHIDREIIKTQKEIVYTMGEIGETRSEETGNHVRRVAEYSRVLALGCGLSEEEADLIHMASPMHDIGKVGIPDKILKKPGKLTAEEYEVMQTHAQLGFDMLNHSDRPILRAAAIIAGEHHEKWDGSGYPKGTSENDIHLYGRITAVVDVFDALGSDRVYKKAWPMEKILRLFEDEKNRHFDPILVDFLLQNLQQFEVIRSTFSDSAPN